MPVTVNTVWTEPAGLVTSSVAQPVAGSTTLYRSLTAVTSFGNQRVHLCNYDQLFDVLRKVIDSATSTSAITLTVGIYPPVISGA